MRRDRVVSCIGDGDKCGAHFFATVYICLGGIVVCAGRFVVDLGEDGVDLMDADVVVLEWYV